MKDNVVIIKTAEWMSALETIVSQKDRIAELEAENARIAEMALDQAEQAIKRIGELEAALQYERNFPSYVERRKIV